MYPEDGNIRGREGFIARPVEGGTWISSSLANGGLHDLPPNEQYVKATAGAMRTSGPARGPTRRARRAAWPRGRVALARRGRRVPNRGPRQVSQTAAKRAKREGQVEYHQTRTVVDWQKGANAEKLLIEDALLGAKGKKMVVFADMFSAVGDKTMAWYSIFRERGGTNGSQLPLTTYFAAEPREHFYQIGRTRLTAQAALDFNAGKLDCPGYVPLPELRE